MPLEDILEKIAKQAAAEASAIIAVAKKEAADLLDEAAKEASQSREKIIGQAETVAKREVDILRAVADTERRQSILQEKQDLVSSVFEKALAHLAALPEGEYKGLMAAAVAEAMTGGEEILLDPGDENRLGGDFAGFLEAELQARGKSPNFTLEYDGAVTGGGFVLRQGGISLNVTFPAVLQKLLDELEIEIARVLFQE